MPKVKCKICVKEFYAKPSHQKMGWGKYSSISCQRIGSRTGKFLECLICGKKIWRTPKDIRVSKSGKFFCTKSCQTLWRNKYFSGPRHPNWQGGKFIDYRGKMLKADAKPICKLCGHNDERVMIVHHIDKNRENHYPSNLVWLCHNCHYLIHNYKISIE